MRNNREFRTSYGTVRNINNRKIKKRKLKKIVAVTLAASSLITIMLLVGSGKDDLNSVPNNQLITYVSMQIESGDTLNGIVDRFYTDEFEGFYRSDSDYKKAIKELNDIEGSYLREGNNIMVPIVVEKDNPYLLKKLEIKDEIQNIKENNLWIKYTVKGGETLLLLAARASDSESESYKIMEDIAEKNNIETNATLPIGKELWIMNPELGKLKIELNIAEKEFDESVIVRNTKK